MRATAWILDLSHRSRRVACDVPDGVRPLTAICEAARRELAIELDVPLGLRADGAAPEFLFVVSRREATWVPLPELEDRGFALYVDAMLGGWAPPTRALDAFHFGDTPELAAQLAHLVVKGVKRGTASWIAAAARDGQVLGQPGMVSIVTDGFGHALCVIEIQRIEHLRFAEIGAEHAWIDGEGDRTLDWWRDGHLDYFTREAGRLGLVFTEDAVIQFERFRLIAVLGRPDTP